MILPLPVKKRLCVNQVSDNLSITFCCYKVKTCVSERSTAQSPKKACRQNSQTSLTPVGLEIVSSVMGLCHPMKVLVIFQLK